MTKKSFPATTPFMSKAKKDKKSKSGLISTNQTVAVNKRARFDYTLEDTFEAGLALLGTEVKSLRHGQCSIKESYIGYKDGEIWAYNLNIPEYAQAGPPQRRRQMRSPHSDGGFQLLD